MTVLNLAATIRSTKALGPGLRSVIWVMGCPFNCHQCISPEWIPFKPGLMFDPEDLAKYLLEDPLVSGITISGGEPMLQAAGLSQMAEHARKIREIDIICFSGFTLAQLENLPEEYHIKQFLDQIDILVDGQYISSQNNDLGLRGSTNQRVHHLTHRLIDHDFEGQPREVDLRVNDGYVFMIGIPTKGIARGLRNVLSRDHLVEKLPEAAYVRS